MSEGSGKYRERLDRNDLELAEAERKENEEIARELAPWIKKLESASLDALLIVRQELQEQEQEIYEKLVQSGKSSWVRYGLSLLRLGYDLDKDPLGDGASYRLWTETIPEDEFAPMGDDNLKHALRIVQTKQRFVQIALNGDSVQRALEDDGFYLSYSSTQAFLRQYGWQPDEGIKQARQEKTDRGGGKSAPEVGSTQRQGKRGSLTSRQLSYFLAVDEAGHIRGVSGWEDAYKRLEKKRSKNLPTSPEGWPKTVRNGVRRYYGWGKKPWPPKHEGFEGTVIIVREILQEIRKNI